MHFNVGHKRAAKLTGEEVIRIRERYARGETQRALAAEYGVSKETVGRVVRGETWAELINPAADSGAVGTVRQVSQEEIDASLARVQALLAEPSAAAAEPSIPDILKPTPEALARLAGLRGEVPAPLPQEPQCPQPASPQTSTLNSPTAQPAGDSAPSTNT